MQWDIAIDVGGTFVDLVARSADGRWRSAKRLRSTADTADAIAEALFDFLDRQEIAAADVARLRHGTTVATNALLELREPPVALITTQGFADVLTLGRQNRRDLRQSFPQPPVPPHVCPDPLRFELAERVDAHGHIVTPLAPAALDALLDRIAASCVAPRSAPAVAVCLLFAPLNPAHELMVAGALRARWPGIHLSLSHQADPRLREFERTLSTVLDAYIRPAVSGYLRRLNERLTQRHLPKPSIMRSMGGLAPAPVCVDAPLTLAMSGPAAASNAIRNTASRHSAATAIGIDIGGTSTDICLIGEGAILTANALTLGALDIRVPSADIASVAVGGGSILRMAGGFLRVGPHSAGSNPGPACFGRGGTEPTLTDAALVSGLLPDRLGGDLVLDRERAVHSLMTGLGGGAHDVSAVAAGAVRVAEAMIAESVRRKAFARGVDPRDAVLVAAGGGGALHAAEIADRIGCRTVIVPPAAGILAAAGLMQVGFCEQTERPVEMPLAPEAVAALRVDAAGDAARMRETVRQWSGDGSAAVRHELEISYQGQGHSLAVAFDPDADDAPSLAARFDALHERVRGHAFETRRRILALRSIATAAIGNTDDAQARATTAADPRESGKPGGLGPRLRGEERFEVFEREALQAGTRLAGPALIDADNTTIRLPQGWRCEVAADEALILTAVERAP